MELSLEPSRSSYSVRRVAVDSVMIGSQVLKASFVVTPDVLLEGWPERCVADIDDNTLARLLAIQPQPDVVLLGSGTQQQLAPQRIQAELLSRGIGLECMDNAACARTFNLLLNEGRRVAAAFLLP